MNQGGVKRSSRDIKEESKGSSRDIKEEFT